MFLPEESILYLLKETGITDTEENKRDGLKVAEALGNLPLALEQAASFIKYENIPFTEYLEEFSPT